MEYTVLTDDDRAKILRNRVLQYEADHYSATLDLGLAEERGDTEVVAVLREKLADLDQAHALARAEAVADSGPRLPSK